MPVVFVHGVNNRAEDVSYQIRQAVTERFMVEHLAGATINGKKLTTIEPVFPYWGDLATTFAWNMRSVPLIDAGVDVLGGADDDMRDIVAGIRDMLGAMEAVHAHPLLAIARKSLPDAVELLTDALLSLRQNELAKAGDQSAIVSFVTEAQAYAAAVPAPSWLMSATTDDAFIALLLENITHDLGDDALGNPFKEVGRLIASVSGRIGSAVKKAVGAGVDAIGDYASSKLVAATRMSLNAELGRFFGDVFAYLDQRGDRQNPGPIVRRILSALQTAPDQPLVVFGHSLGGVILYDVLTHFAQHMRVDLLVTVGSQVSHFEEMKRFRASRHDIPSGTIPYESMPANVAHWLNIFDPVDIFSYCCEPVFDGVKDFDYDTRTYVVKAHGSYFAQRRFYSGLRERIDGLAR